MASDAPSFRGDFAADLGSPIADGVRVAATGRGELMAKKKEGELECPRIAQKRTPVGSVPKGGTARFMVPVALFWPSVDKNWSQSRRLRYMLFKAGRPKRKSRLKCSATAEHDQ